MQVLLWLLLMMMVNVGVSVAPGIALRIGLFDVSTGAPTEWVLLAWSVSILVAVAGIWVFEGACRWFCRYLRFSDNTRADFSGSAVEILGWWVLWVLTGRRWNVIGEERIVLGVSLFLLGLWSTLNILRWFVAHVEFSSGRRLSFSGTYLQLLGWELLLGVSIFTVIGWAWVAAAMGRWFARNTRSSGVALAFQGLGVQILWRTVVTILFSIPVVTIPWAWLWYARWLVQNTTIEGPLGDVTA